MDVCSCSGGIQRYRSCKHLPSPDLFQPALAGVEPVVDVRGGLVGKYSVIFESEIHRMPNKSDRRVTAGQVGKNLVEEREDAQFSLLPYAAARRASGFHRHEPWFQTP